MWSRKLIDGLVQTFGMFLFIAVPSFIISAAFSSRTAMIENADVISGSNYRILTGEGNSMYPTIKNGEKFKVYTDQFPKVGDIINFRCLSREKCGDAWKIDRGGEFNTTSHRWVSTDPDGCMHIIGDNVSIEWDENFCLYPTEIEIEGVVHKLPF